MRLELLAGPLEESRILAIASLYGGFNAKYREPDFCRRLFNQNPHGASLHAFVLDDEGRAAGHYAIVPLAIRSRGERRLSGKGEAFVVREDCRDASVAVGGDPPLSIGMVMPLHLYPFAVAHGLEPVHMLAPPAVAPLHRMSGCRSVDPGIRRVGIVLRPRVLASDPGQTVSSALVLAAASGLAVAARAVSGLVLARAGRAGRWRAARATPGQLAHVAADWTPPAGWGMEIDTAMLEWQSRLSEFEWIELGDGLGHALVCSRAGDGRAMEILQLRPRRPGTSSMRQLLAAVILHASGRGSVLLGLSDRVVDGEPARATLLAAARTLGLRARSRQAGMLVYTRDRYFLDPANLRFDPFFHAAF